MKLKRLNRLLMLLVAFMTMCVTQVWGAETTIASWSYASRTANTAYAPTTNDANNSGARLKSECGLTTQGSGGSASAYYGTWTNGKAVIITGLSMAGYVNNSISLTINLRHRQSGSASFYYSTDGSTYPSSANATKSITNTSTDYSITSIPNNVKSIKVTISGNSAGNLWLGNVTIKGEAAAAVSHTVTFDAGSNGTCSTNSLTETSAGVGVTLPNVEEKSGFVFKGWATTSGASTANAGIAGANYKPSSNCTLYAVYGNLYTVTLGDNSATLTQTTEGGNVTLPSRTGNATWTFAGWSETNNATETTTAPTIIKAGDYKPSANVTLYPVYTRSGGGGSTTVTQDYETAVAPTGWTSNSITRTNGDGISPHGGSYWGSIAVNGTAYIQYNTALTGNVTVTAYVARTTSNTNKGEFKIQTKSGSNSWTDRGTAVDVKSTTVDEWQTLTWTGTLSTEQVRILYTGGTTAIRAIDDVSIVIGTSTTYYISVVGPTTYTASVVSPAPSNGSIN